MIRRPSIIFVAFLAFLAVGFSSFADTLEIKTAESMNGPSDDSSEADESKEDVRDKRAGEEIMFGNQQNKANGLVDDILAISEKLSTQDDGDAKNETGKKDDHDDAKSEDHDDDEHHDDDSDEHHDVDDEAKSEEKRNLGEDQTQSENEMGPEGAEVSSRWYSGAPVPSEALQYLLNSPLQSMRSTESFVDMNNIYDQGDLYRRKRQLMRRPVALVKRSFRSPLGQLIRARSQRVPRRSMRIKRQIDVEDFLNFLRNAQASNVDNNYYKPVSGRLNNFRYHGNGYQLPYDVAENDVGNYQDVDSNLRNKPDMSDNFLYSPSPRYVDVPDYNMPYRSKAEQNEVPTWMEREIPPPSIFTVSRRSTPLFYPIDYRYVPGHKKRSIMDEDDESDANFGKWGRVVQVPEAYASPEDIARLYYLANMLAERENAGLRTRRSA